MTNSNENSQHGLIKKLKSALIGVEQSIQQIHGLKEDASGEEQRQYEEELSKLNTEREKLVKKINDEEKHEKDSE